MPPISSERACAVSDGPGRHPDAGLVALPDLSDSLAAPVLKETLAAAMGLGGPLRLLGQDVERITTACAQLLVSADRTLVRRGDRLSVLHASDAMRMCLTELGLLADLDRWSSVDE